jgi:hypothetical protein
MSLQPVERSDSSASNLPATATDTRLTTPVVRRPGDGSYRQPVSVAFLPLAIVTFLVLAFAMALWTFLAATT